ncbi:MAG: DinB family protein [Flavobacteriales bacterium]|nr:DinB family protein [Flavobacteriales bacterium]
MEVIQYPNDNYYDEVRDRIGSLTDQVQLLFSHLTGEQLNTKPEPGRWSIGECLDHLITTNRSYYPAFQALSKANRRPSFWERFSPFSHYFGKLLIETTGPTVTKKYKSPPAFRSTRSSVPDDIVSLFAKENEQLVELTDRMRMNPPLQTIVTSPASNLVTYTLGDALEIILGHEQRHINQAKAVLDMTILNKHTQEVQ